MIRLSILGEMPKDDGQILSEALHAIADDIATGGWSGDSIVDAWSGRTDVDLGRPIITGLDQARATRFVTWGVIWDDK